MTEETPRRDAPGEPVKEPSEKSAAEQPSGEAGGDAGGQAIPLEAIATRELLVWMLGVLGAKAWQGMGLVPNPSSGKLEKDMADAKIAIDAFSALLDAMRPQMDAQARRDTEALLTTLRLNFVEKSRDS